MHTTHNDTKPRDSNSAARDSPSPDRHQRLSVSKDVPKQTHRKKKAKQHNAANASLTRGLRRDCRQPDSRRSARDCHPSSPFEGRRLSYAPLLPLPATHFPCANCLLAWLNRNRLTRACIPVSPIPLLYFFCWPTSLPDSHCVHSVLHFLDLRVVQRLITARRVADFDFGCRTGGNCGSTSNRR